MAGQAIEEDDIVVGINVTPLVDITLVLLIVFIVTAKLVTQQGIPMDLPKAASAGATQTIFTVSVDQEGKVFADGAPVDDARLRQLALQTMKDKPDTRTVVQAAATSKHADVLHVVDTLREAGVVKIAFAADRAMMKAKGTP